jgi:hypothetical protein
LKNAPNLAAHVDVAHARQCGRAALAATEIQRGPQAVVDGRVFREVVADAVGGSGKPAVGPLVFQLRQQQVAGFLRTLVGPSGNESDTDPASVRARRGAEVADHVEGLPEGGGCRSSQTGEQGGGREQTAGGKRWFHLGGSVMERGTHPAAEASDAMCDHKRRNLRS